MFSLIITIVSIALVVALVGATMYHGGDTLTQGRASAEASAYVTGAQQIGGAAVMHGALASTDLTSATALQDLVAGNYLSSVPSLKSGEFAIDTATRRVTATVSSATVCDAINKAAGLAEDAEAEDIAAAPYSCTGTAFTFKY